eukprot:COSAG05_NODE_4611_length_1439_cov_1.273134_1_plen_104_part_10
MPLVYAWGIQVGYSKATADVWLEMPTHPLTRGEVAYLELDRQHMPQREDEAERLVGEAEGGDGPTFHRVDEGDVAEEVSRCELRAGGRETGVRGCCTRDERPID